MNKINQKFEARKTSSHLLWLETKINDEIRGFSFHCRVTNAVTSRNIHDDTPNDRILLSSREEIFSDKYCVVVGERAIRIVIYNTSSCCFCFFLYLKLLNRILRTFIFIIIYINMIHKSFAFVLSPLLSRTINNFLTKHYNQ